MTQSRLVRMRYAAGGPASQTVGVHLLLRGAVDLGRLREAFLALVERHSILRTNYGVSDDDEVFAIVHEDGGPDVFSVAAPTGLVDEGDVREHANGLFEGIVDRFKAPDRHSMLQAVVVPHVEGVHSLLLTIDHIAVDERSKALLQRELAELYAGRAAGLARPRAYDPAAVRNEFPGLDESPQVLGLVTPLPPRLFSGLGPQSPPEAFVPVGAGGALGSEVWGRVGAATRRLRATRFTVHVAALLWALKQFSGSDDVSLVTAMDTRRTPADFDTVGFFQNLVLLRSRSPRAAGLAATLAESRALVRDSLQRRDYPIAALVARAAAERAGVPCQNPLYQVVLAYAVEDVDLGWALDGVDVRPVVLEHPQMTCELLAHLTESADDTVLDLLGAAGVLAAADLERLVALWRDAVAEVTREAVDPPQRACSSSR
ncbi:condensation domain-containing protein [Actinokineospora pegani]|uniref:hypothetical protein n=1 Tax=Actinokineospora pegani TaxID=2654637 RepID=UPI0018D3271E|nr:hypothetical protein [Actinokineospora pegani]